VATLRAVTDQGNTPSAIWDVFSEKAIADGNLRDHGPELIEELGEG
jgi:hypothetical protein